MFSLFGRLFAGEKGVTTIEYAVLGSFIAMVIAVAIDAVGNNLNAVFINVAANL